MTTAPAPLDRSRPGGAARHGERTPPAAARAVSATRFGGLRIEYGDGALAPRPWTILQSAWAIELSAGVPDGGVLELCSGVGHIGLVVAHRTGRRLVQVEGDAGACRSARRNALVAGLGECVDVREADLAHGVSDDERFPLVLADPPYVPRGEVDRFPEDPVHAIDGGEDGLDVARRCIDVIGTHLATAGVALVQLRDSGQARALLDGRPHGLRLAEVRTDGPERAVALLRR